MSQAGRVHMVLIATVLLVLCLQVFNLLLILSNDHRKWLKCLHKFETVFNCAFENFRKKKLDLQLDFPPPTHLTIYSCIQIRFIACLIFQIAVWQICLMQNKFEWFLFILHLKHSKLLSKWKFEVTLVP